MNYKICKMKFQTEVHFGRNFLSDSEYSCYADTLFSALCHEYIKLNGTSNLEQFVEQFRQNQVLISDTFPYIGDEYWIPKPIIVPKEMDLYNQKDFKKVSFIPVDELKNYFNGTLNSTVLIKTFREFGDSAVHVKASLHGLEEANPYWIGGYRFAENNGLYILIGYENQEIYEELKNILVSLSYTGIGGKITSGYGTFEVEFQEVPKTWISHLCNGANQDVNVEYMTLSLSLPKNEELDKSLNNAHYQVVRRGGFVSEANFYEGNVSYGSEQRKQDLYAFQAGSCFESLFDGDIYDVSNQGPHPVYRYAKPMFWRLSL